ncbi:hypothetical protein EON67_02075 [archaeon]|nr:MAG: hypothetical protein EON67_02075 [archaeon]
MGTIAQEPVVYVGRIVADTDTGDGRLNSTSLAIEGYAADAGAQSVQHTRVTLDLREVPGFSLFPGQIVAVKGINAVGHRMLVQALYHGAPAPQLALPSKSANAMVLAAANKTGGALSVWVAAGPFTVAANCAFDPLRDFFLEAVAADRIPDVIVLVREVHVLYCACLPSQPATRIFARLGAHAPSAHDVTCDRARCSVAPFWMRSTPPCALAWSWRRRRTAARLRSRTMTFGMKRVRAAAQRHRTPARYSFLLACVRLRAHGREFPPRVRVRAHAYAVVYPLSAYLANPKMAHTRVVLIPSWNDAFSHPTLPQPPYSAESLSIIEDDSVRQVRACSQSHARACMCVRACVCVLLTLRAAPLTSVRRGAENTPNAQPVHLPH